MKANRPPSVDIKSDIKMNEILVEKIISAFLKERKLICGHFASFTIFKVLCKITQILF